MSAPQLFEYRKDTIWISEYPIRYAGGRFNARMTIVRLRSGNLLIHSPCAISDDIRDAINRLGRVESIVAPGSYHHFHVASAQEAFPDAETFICPGIERKQPRLEFDWVLGGRADRTWEDDFD